jgi:hypothetical protein
MIAVMLADVEQYSILGHTLSDLVMRSKRGKGMLDISKRVGVNRGQGKESVNKSWLLHYWYLLRTTSLASTSDGF